MRISLKLVLEKNEIVLDYRSFILSFVKSSLEKNYVHIYEEMYQGNNSKLFTFSVFLPGPKVVNKKILLKENHLIVTFSFLDNQLGLAFYNSMFKSLKKSFRLPQENAMMLLSINVLRLPNINSNKIVVKFLSQLVVRDHDKESNKDIYLDYTNDEFENKLNVVLKNFFDNNEGVGTFSPITIKAIDAKRTVVVALKNKINCSYGIFEISSSKEVLSICQKVGLGSRRNLGFGEFEVIKQYPEVSDDN